MPNPRPLFVALTLAALTPGRAQQPADAVATSDALSRLLTESVAAIENAGIPVEAVPTLERLGSALGEGAAADVAARVLELCRTTTDWEAVDAAAVQQLLEQTVAARQNGRTELVAAAIAALSRFAPERVETRSLRFELFGRATPLFDVAKAIQALGQLRGMMPDEHDGWGDIARKVLGLAFLASDVADGIAAVPTLISYWNGCEALLQAGRPIRTPTPSDARVFGLLPALHGAYLTGRREDVLAGLDAWAQEQPDNVAQLVLSALARSSLSWGRPKDRYAPDAARALLARVLEHTDPQTATESPATAWTFPEVRAVLLRFGVRCGDSVDALRRYVTELDADLRQKRGLPLAHFADYVPLARQVETRGGKLAKRQRDLAELDGLVADAERAVRAAGGRPGKTPGTFDMGDSNQREKLAGLIRTYDARRKKRDTLAETLADEEAALQRFRSRLADYDRARSR